MLDWVGEYLSPALVSPVCVGSSHSSTCSSPSLTKGKMIGLPSEFACYGENSRGGGVIQVH